MTGTARTIFKFVMDKPTVTIDVPLLAQFLTVDAQAGDPCLWFEVNPDAPKRQMTFVAVPTGRACPDDGTYLGTAHLREDGLVLHIYDTTAATENTRWADTGEDEDNALCPTEQEDIIVDAKIVAEMYEDDDRVTNAITNLLAIIKAQGARLGD